MARINLRSQVQDLLPRVFGGTDNEWGAASRWLLVYKENDSGSSIAVGTLVQLANGILPTQTAGGTVSGVIVGRIGTSGKLEEVACGTDDNCAIAISGLVTVLTTGTATTGYYVSASSTAGKALVGSSVVGGTFGQVIHPMSSTKAAVLLGNGVVPSGGGVGNIEDLPTAETNTTLVLAPDGVGGVEFRAEVGGSGLGWYDVKTYGATGNGTTDDTSDINSAIADLVANGSGVLYFPAGAYKTTGALTALSVPFLVLGDGQAGFDGISDYGSKVLCTSQTADLFTATAEYGRFQGIALRNTYAGTPSAGSGIQVSGGSLTQRVDFDAVTVSGFYDNVDVQVGCIWTMQSCYIHAPVHYGLKIDNTVNDDAGDWAISDSAFFSELYNSTAAIRIEGSGGGKIVNVKINKGLDSKFFTTGIDIAIGAGDDTSVFLLSNSSIENVSGDAVRVTTTSTGSFGLFAIYGLQVALYSNNTGRAVKVSAASAGGNVAGGIYDLVIDSSVFRTTGTARAAIELTNPDNIVLGDIVLDGFNARYTSSGATNIADGTSISYATPAIVLGTAAAAGAASTVIRSDSTIVAFDATVPVTQAFGDAAATGSAAVAARRDHVHGMPATPTTTSGLGGEHIHVAEEIHLSDGATTTFTLDAYYEPGSIQAWNRTTIARLLVTEILPDQVTISAAGSTGDQLIFDYAATLV